MALNGEFDVIIHGCNCECSMNGGIAKQIKNAFPAAYKAEAGTESCDATKMGSFSYAKVKLMSQKRLIIVNGYTQLLAGGQVNYIALRKVMQQVKQNFYGTRIGYPMIGSGLAGGEWAIIEDIIKEELSGEDHTLVEFSQTKSNSYDRQKSVHGTFSTNTREGEATSRARRNRPAATKKDTEQNKKKPKTVTHNNQPKQKSIAGEKEN